MNKMNNFFSFVEGFFREDKPQSMTRLTSFLFSVSAIIIGVYTVTQQPEDGTTICISMASIGISQKLIQKREELNKEKHDIYGEKIEY